MTWLALGFLNMAFITGLRLFQKSVVNRYPTLNTFRLNWLSALIGLPVFLYIVFQNAHQITGLSEAFWLTLFAVVVGFYPMGNYLYFSVIRKHELSNVLPLLGFIPILTALFGWILLSQPVTTSALIGIVCICLSIYFLRADNTSTWYAPIVSLSRSSAARAMFAASIITALAAIGDKYAIEKSSSIYFALNSIGAILVLFLCDYLLQMRKKPTFFSELSHIPRKQIVTLVLLGIVFVLTQLIGFAAVNKAMNTSYIIAIRNINIVLASLIAVVLYKESITRNKLLCYGLSAIGIVMIAL